MTVKKTSVKMTMKKTGAEATEIQEDAISFLIA